jgi:alkylation response protein AidB-like acyl-CoA dehydrogenase
MIELDEFRKGLDGWLDENEGDLKLTGHTLDDEMVHLSKVKRIAFDAGWMRYGWPERVGGLGGSTLLRAYLGEALTMRNLVAPGAYSMAEVLLPTLIDYAPPALAAEMVPKHLSGEETFCQGFSEPGTGSNLGSLACRATPVDNGFRVTGQKVWTSYAQYAQRCVLLTRTGTLESAHRGITAFFVDMDTPGITVRPIQAMHGADEFCEVFFDDVAVPVDRMLGMEGQGWEIAMNLLPFERSTALWHRGAFLQRRLKELLETVDDDALDPMTVGDTALQLYAFRARSRATQYRLAGGERLGPETSIDKVLLATTDHAVFDLVAEGLGEGFMLDDDAATVQWRSDYFYSRAATIYGGTAEIQRNIIAKRLLGLGNG